MPYLKFPTHSKSFGNDGVEGGLIVPLSFAIGKGMDLGAMVDFGVASDGGGTTSGKHFELVTSTTLGKRPWTSGKLTP